jgi:hypothetical protein
LTCVLVEEYEIQLDNNIKIMIAPSLVGLWCLTPFSTMFQLYSVAVSFITLSIFYCSKRQKDKTQVKQLRQSSPNFIGGGIRNTQRKPPTG